MSELVKIALSLVLVVWVVIPEPTSTALGVAGLFAIWGIDWNGAGGGG